ncbi:MAG: hypothetical protein H7Y15_18680 [Pseudonocardia sp.]|nr:hypothetical protein [Pseudonocardia sp.]
MNKKYVVVPIVDKVVSTMVVLVLAVAGLLVSPGAATAGVAIPQSSRDGRWILGPEPSSLHGRTFVGTSKDCRGGRYTWRDLPASPVTGVTYSGRLSTFRARYEGNVRVCEATTIDYSYKFWFEGGDSGARQYLRLELADVDTGISAWYRHRVGDREPVCRTTQTVDRSFYDRLSLDPTSDRRIFTVQFTSLSFCFDGSRVWFQDDAQPRLYIGGNFSNYLQGACAGAPRTAVDRRLSSIYITCNAVFSNRTVQTFVPRADFDSGAGSEFTIIPNLNAGAALGTRGSVALPPPADPSKFYTLRLYANGCYEFSGVGDARQYC